MNPPQAAQAACAWQWACALDVMVAKPGNVSVAAPGHRMTAQMFLDSAAAAAVPLFRPGATVGRRIEEAIEATWAAVHCNTNLGIVLLSAPLAAALERCGEATVPLRDHAWRDALHTTLQALDVEDARAAYRGIARAQPAGLGRAAEQDVAQWPTIGLRQAMALAADRDSIARQYAGAFADVFELGLPAFQRALQAGRAGSAVQDAIVATFLTWLARWPDSHIARKHGAAQADAVSARAHALRQSCSTLDRESRATILSTWDTELKTAGINPGTSADLTVATAFVAACLDPSLVNA